MKQLATLVFAALLTAACTTNNFKPEKAMNEMNPSNKEKVTSLLASIETGDHAPVGFINPGKYIQHNLMVGDGLQGFGEVLKQLPEGSAKARVVRAFQDGDYIFTHTEYDFFGPKIGFDIFRFEDGKIVEHWDNLQETVLKTASGRSQIDGPSKAADLDKTEANKALVKGFVEDILMKRNPLKVTDYISTKAYFQHNPYIADGLEPLGRALEQLASAGNPLIIRKVHMILGEGNFVLVTSEGEFMKKPSAFYDLFRVEDDRIVEHWDTIETIPPKEQWKNGNGKF